MINTFISICTIPTATKHGKFVTHREGLPLINLNSPLNMCSREIIGKFKSIIFPL